MEFGKLPDKVHIGDGKLVYPTDAPNRLSQSGMTIHDAITHLGDLHDESGNEHGCAIIGDYQGNLQFGGACEGDENRVSMSVPLSRREYTSPLGLTIYRDDVIAAVLHTHQDGFSFSLQDIADHLLGGRLQTYVEKPDRTIDMVQSSSESRLIEKDVLRRLVQLWDSYLKPDGSFRDDLSEDEYEEFLRRISGELKLGFYTNKDEDDLRILSRHAK